MQLTSLLLTLSIATVRGWYMDVLPPSTGFADYVSSPTPLPPTLGYFLRDFNATNTTVPLSANLPSFLHGMKHYRLLPASFPNKMPYHFDGLATVLKFEIAADGTSMTYRSKLFQSEAAIDYKKCIFYGTGTGPTLGTEICFTNPGVNLLPIDDQLWLTIDTDKWGRVDPETLDTVKGAKVNVSSLVLNAHPACDRAKNVCYVQHPCPKQPLPLSDQICFSILQPSSTSGSMGSTIVARATMDKQKIIQHSHSPCLTENYVVSKIDSFVVRNPLNQNHGLLKFMKQGEDDLYFVLDRNTNKTKLIRGNINFVNNHFWNCYENQIGDIVIEAVAATDEYLDTYFDRNLARGHPTWSDMFHPPIRCHLSFAEATANCVPMFQQLKKDAGESWNPTNVLFDYPTFNPHYKMDSSYRYFYAIGITSNTSGWFDRVIKVDVRTDTITHAWSSPDVYLTEFDFVPAHSSEEGGKNEDNGVLISIVYNKTSDMSFFTMLNATNLQLLGMYPMEHAVPFHAHGIVCKSGVPCFTNP